MDFGWKRSFRLELEERKVFGLDIGSSSVNAVQLEKKSDDWVVTAAGRVRIAPNQEDGRGTNTVSAIGKCFESMGIRTQMAVCGVSGPEVAVRDFMFHSLARDEVEPAVMLEAAQVCPFNADDVTVDYQSICSDKDSTRGILVAATKRLINRRKDLAKQAAVNCVLMDVDGLALLNCLSECEKAVAQQTAAILNIGHSYTTLAIMGSQGGLALPFIRDVAYSGNDITKAIAIANDISKEAVEEVLFGGKSSTEKPIVFENALDQACEKLIVDVTQTLRYYTAQENSNFVEKIFVCGAFAAVPGLVELLGTQLPTKIELWNPLEKLGCEADQKCKSILLKDGHAMAVAAGLAMRSI
ncbi:MAG: type IV pilus assembly protein PilM [Planctomycetes bacterium]|nr:type IV pilus assembly protein PilM [Planctomycetota bacterium]